MIAQPMQLTTRAASLVCVVLALSACSGGPVRPDARQPGVESPRPAETHRVPDVGHRAARIALQQLGTPYRYGGQSPSGFDCSGLVHYSYYHAGVSVPRTTQALWHAATPVRRSQLRVGDLLFFSIDGKMSHVGLYVGNGRFVHAPSSGKVVKVESLYSPFYSEAFLRAGRPH